MTCLMIQQNSVLTTNTTKMNTPFTHQYQNLNQKTCLDSYCSILLPVFHLDPLVWIYTFYWFLLWLLSIHKKLNKLWLLKYWIFLLVHKVVCAFYNSWFSRLHYRFRERMCLKSYIFITCITMDVWVSMLR